jgi:hypothetical protein
VSVQCPACHAELDLVVACRATGPPAPASVESTPDAGARRWLLEVENETLEQLYAEQRRAGGLREELGR